MKTIAFTVLVGLSLMVYETGHANEEVKLNLTYMPVSKHHGDTDTTNETHHGVGFNVGLDDNPLRVGYMFYENSYDDDSHFVYVGGEFGCTDVIEVCFGAMGGYATGYEDHQQSSILGGLTARYKWVQLLTVPGEVTALIITVPINELMWRK